MTQLLQRELELGQVRLHLRKPLLVARDSGVDLEQLVLDKR